MKQASTEIDEAAEEPDGTVYKPQAETVAHGYGRASRMGGGVLAPDMRQVLDEFATFHDRPVRAAFAHHWVAIVRPPLSGHLARVL